MWRKRRYYLCLQCENLTGVSEQKNTFEAAVIFLKDSLTRLFLLLLTQESFFRTAVFDTANFPRRQFTVQNDKSALCFVMLTLRRSHRLDYVHWDGGEVRCVCVCGQGWGWGGLGSCDWWVYYSHTSFLFISPALLLNLLVASRWSSKSFFFFVVAFAATCLSNWRQSRLFWPADTKHVTVR